MKSVTVIYVVCITLGILLGGVLIHVFNLGNGNIFENSHSLYTFFVVAVGGGVIVPGIGGYIIFRLWHTD